MNRRIGILGSGIMGSSLALLLARRGARVSVFDESPLPFNGASRWNEGKIHLGYLYAGDPSLSTARKVIPGGLSFRNLVEDLLGKSISEAYSYADDIYLTHADSVVEAEAMETYLKKVFELVRDHPNSKDYSPEEDGASIKRLSARELEAISASPRIHAGFRVPERSVRTRWIADQFVEALNAETKIELVQSARVIGVRPVSARWMVDLQDECNSDKQHGPFDIIINALWHGKSAIDATIGMPENGDRSYRFRASLFLKSKRDWELPSAVVSTGPFGDVKNYNKREFYFSWYPAGLLVDSSSPQNIQLTDLAMEPKARIVSQTLAGLQEYFPLAAEIAQDAKELIVGGGWVVADGKGQLSDPRSRLHKRDQFGVSSLGTYLTIDTGKYSTAPLIATHVASEL